jgi:hypothetical protein
MTEPLRPKERRLHPRYVVEGTIELGGAEGPAYLRDLSMSGLSCLSPRAFDDMTVLEISMQLPFAEGKQLFKAGGAVVRCEKHNPNGWNIAVFFTQMDAANSKVLADFIQRQAR